MRISDYRLIFDDIRSNISRILLNKTNLPEEELSNIDVCDFLDIGIIPLYNQGHYACIFVLKVRTRNNIGEIRFRIDVYSPLNYEYMDYKTL